MRGCMNFAKGMGAGMVAGIALAVTVKCMCQKSRKMARYTNRAARTVSGIMEDIQELLR